MKIKIFYKDDNRYEFIRKALIDKDKTMAVAGGNYAAHTLPQLVNGSPPDVMILDDGMENCLAAVEALSLHSPGMDTLIISADTSAEFLLRAMRAGVREVVPLSGGQDALQAAMTRITHKRSGRAKASTQDGRVFAFISCKGGSGATFLAANFAYVLAVEFKKRVVLIDLNLQFGDAALFVSNSTPPCSVAELARQVHRLDASLLEASMLEAAPNFFVLAAPEDPAHSIDVKREHIEAIVHLAQSHYDFVVLDVSRSLDALSLHALDMADTIFPVLQLTLPFVRDGKRLLSIFRSLGYPHSKIKLLVNRFEKGGELSLRDLEQAVSEKVFEVIPNSYQAAASSVNLGVPILKAARNNQISSKLATIGKQFVPDKSQSTNGNWLGRIFHRTQILERGGGPEQPGETKCH